MRHLVYILQSDSSGRYYIGATADVKRRLDRHNAGYAKAAKAWVPWKLKRVEEFPTVAQARKRKARIKRMKSRAWIARLLGERAGEIGRVRGSPPEACAAVAPAAGVIFGPPAILL